MCIFEERRRDALSNNIIEMVRFKPLKPILWVRVCAMFYNCLNVSFIRCSRTFFFAFTAGETDTIKFGNANTDLLTRSLSRHKPFVSSTTSSKQCRLGSSSTPSPESERFTSHSLLECLSPVVTEQNRHLANHRTTAKWLSAVVTAK